MFTCVMGLPASGYIGFAFMSTVDFEAAADAWSALGVARLTAPVVVASVSGLTGAGLAGLSLAPDLWGIFRISLYFDCLWIAQKVNYAPFGPNS